MLWLTSSCLVDLGVESDSSFLLYCPLLVMITMFGRLMQASAHSLAIAVCYELAATAGELWEGRDLMRGTTPGIKWQNFRRRVSRVATRVGIDLGQSGESCDERQDPFSDPLFGPLASELGSSSNLVTEPSPATMQQLMGTLSPRESSPAQKVFEEATAEGIANDDPRWREDEEKRSDDEEGGDDIDDISPHSGDGVRENRRRQPSEFEIMRTVTPDATSPYHTGRTLASAVEDRRVIFCANVLIASMMAEAVTIFVATALNFTVPTNFDKFGVESEPLSDKQVS